MICCPGKDRNITVGKMPFCNQLLDTSCDLITLCQFYALTASFDHYDLGLRIIWNFRLRVISPCIQRVAVCVIDSAHFRDHDLLEDKVGKVDDFLTASIVFIKNDPFSAFCFSVCFILFQEQIRTCQAECVNTLFYISDHKNIRSSKTFCGKS